MTYAIHRYPAGLIDVVRLRDGTRVTIRPILPQDAEIEQAFVRGLSVSSRHSRFFHAIKELPPSLLRSLTQIDYTNHVALIAEIFVEGAEVVIGDGRYVIDEEPHAAEFALAVADDWRGQGLAGLLLERLERHAAASDIRLLFGDTLFDNQPMLELARRCGFSIDPEPRPGGVVRLQKGLAPAILDPACRETLSGLAAA